jgi:hypothetical protein
MDGLKGWRDKSESILRAISPAMPTMRRWLFAFTRASSTIIHRDLPEWRRRSKFLCGINLCRYLDFATKRLISFAARFAIFRSSRRCVCLVPAPTGSLRRSSDLYLAISSPEATATERAKLQICQELLTDPFAPPSPVIRTIPQCGIARSDEHQGSGRVQILGNRTVPRNPARNRQGID